MDFNSLSDAIRYFAPNQKSFNVLTSYGRFAAEISRIPGNVNMVSPNPSSQVLVYGQSVWNSNATVITIYESII